MNVVDLKKIQKQKRQQPLNDISVQSVSKPRNTYSQTITEPLESFAKPIETRKPVSIIKRYSDEYLEYIGHKVVVYSSIVLIAVLSCSLLILSRFIIPGAEDRYQKATEKTLEDISFLSQKIENDVVNNFHEDFFVLEGNKDDAAFLRNIQEAENLAVEIQNLAKEALAIETKYQFLIGDMDGDFKAYCKKSLELGRSYQNLMIYYSEVLKLRQEMVELFKFVPTINNTKTNSLADSAKSFKDKAAEFAELQEKFEAINNLALPVGKNDINVEFLDNWETGLTSLASIADSLNTEKIKNKTIPNDKLKESEKEIKEIASDFDTYLKELEQGAKQNEELIKSFYTQEISSLERMEKNLKKNYYQD